MTISSRAYVSEDDYAALRRFFMELPGMRTQAGPFGATVGDLDWWRFHHEDVDQMLNCQLWIDDSRDAVVGFTWPEGNAIDLYCDPRARAIEPEMISWAVARVQKRGESSITIVACDKDRDRQIALDRAGFSATEAHYTFRGQPLVGRRFEPVLAEGYRFGDLVDADDATIEARVNVHRAAWDRSKYTVEKQRRVMGSPTYRPDLDLVAISANGEYATCMIVWFDAYNRIGVFEPVGCHPDHRQKGLTKAVMYEGMRRLQALGAERAFVNSWHESLPANRLYDSAGFQVVDRQRKWKLSF